MCTRRSTRGTAQPGMPSGRPRSATPSHPVSRRSRRTTSRARRAPPRRGSVPCRRQRCRPDRVRALRNDRRRGACRGRVARPRRDVDFETSVVPLISMFGSHAIEHGSTRTGRWLRERRFRFTLWIATVEGLLYVLHALHWWAAVLLALIAVGFWWYVARGNRSDTLREAG